MLPSSAMKVTDNASLPDIHGDISHAYSVKSTNLLNVFIAEKTGAPVDVATISQILMPVADRWYALGIALGFSTDEMDMMKGASPTLPGAQIAVIVREGAKRCGDLAKFVNILTTALQSPGIGANEVATALARCMCMFSTDESTLIISISLSQMCQLEVKVVRSLVLFLFLIMCGLI